MSGDTFTRDLFSWLNEVASDPTLPPSAFKIAYAIARHVNRQSGEAWPSHRLIASEIRMSCDTVKEMIGRLKQAGHLAVRVGHGPGNPSRYRLRYLTKNREPTPSKISEATPPLNGEPSPPIENRNGGAGPVNGGAGSQKRGSRPPTNYRRTIDEPSEGEISSDVDHDHGRRRNQQAIQAIDTDFEAWYRQYPKRVAKVAALRAYRAVLAKKLATAEELQAGAMRYAAERSGQDPKFTKHPSTWLNGGCWADDPARPTGDAIDQHGYPVTSRPDRQPSWMDIALGGLKRGEP